MTRTLLVVGLIAASATAAPVPKPPPPLNPKNPTNFELGTVKVLKGEVVEFTTSDWKYDSKVVTEKVTRDGKQVEETRVVGQPEPVEVKRPLQLKFIKGFTADGTEIKPDELAKKLAGPVAVVYWSNGMNREWLPLFTNDMIHLRNYDPNYPSPEDK